MFNQLKERLNEMKTHAEKVINDHENSLDRKERAMGLLSGCDRILGCIAAIEKGHARPNFLSIRFNEIQDKLYHPFTIGEASLDNFRAGLKDAWLELNNYLKNQKL